jgi:hypothetical protein
MGRPNLAPTLNYLKLVDQRLIEPIGILRNFDPKIMGIPISVDFKVIFLVEGMPSYATIFSHPWGRRMKAIISLKRDRIKLK